MPTPHKPVFFIHRNKNKQIIRQVMNNLDWEANENAKDLSKSDSLSMSHLQAMQLVAKMKEAADKCGAGFVGGFISPTGQRFMMSNVDADDVQLQEIERQLNQVQEQIVNSRTEQEKQDEEDDATAGVPSYLQEMIRLQIIRRITGNFEG